MTDQNVMGGFTAEEMNGFRRIARERRDERDAMVAGFMADVDRLLRRAQQEGHINRRVRGVLKHLIHGAARAHFSDALDEKQPGQPGQPGQ